MGEKHRPTSDKNRSQNNSIIGKTKPTRLSTLASAIIEEQQYPVKLMGAECD